MATRINTKFVITLASVLILLVLSMVIAFSYLKKGAGDHIQLAEEAMQRADVAMAEGNIKAHNAERKRAAKHFGQAKDKDPSNIECLYGFKEAHEEVVCTTLTSAGNQLESILAGASSIHDTLGATGDDRAVLYGLLHERTRMALFSGSQNPIGAMYAFTSKRLDISAEDPVAKRYQAISLSYMAGSRTSEAEVEEDLQNLNDAIKANPKDPLLQTAAARYHLGNARRLHRAKGNTFTDEVNASYALALKHAELALPLAQDNMPASLEAVAVIADLRSNDESLVKQIAERKREAVVQLDAKLQDKSNRDALFVEELSRAVTILRLQRPDAEDPASFNGPKQALALAEAVVADRPDTPVAYQVLGNIQKQINAFADAEKTVEAGLAIERHANAPQFIRDNEARLNMRSLLVDVKITLALQAIDFEQRDALLKEASALIEELAKADTLQAQWREARLDFLRGRIMLAMNKPRQAVTFLERANQAYSSRDAQTLRLLANTHSRLNNDKLVAGYYETIVSNLQPTVQDLLNLINLYLNPGENQQLERAETLLASYRTQRPEDINGVRLQARLLAVQDKVPEAIAFLREQDLEKYPELMDQIVGLEATTGDTDGAIKLFQERIADRAEGEAMSLPLVTNLLNLLPDAQAKQAELERLVGEGLDTKVADVFKRVLISGKPALEDELELIEIQDHSPAEAAMKKFQLYRRWNRGEEARPFLDEAARLDPDRPDVIEWQFRTALGEKRWPDAQQAIKNMLKLSPSERPAIAVADGRFMRAQILAVQAAGKEVGEARNKQIREAIVAYNNALGEYSHNVEGWIQLGRLHFAQGNAFAAQDSLIEALNRQSRNVEALELMGLAEQATGDQINALERFEQIMTIQPNHPTALDRFTALAQQMDLAERAIALREAIRERAPSNYKNRRVLALLYAQNEAHDKAKVAIQEVIDAQGSTRQNIAVLSQILSSNDTHDQAIQAINGYLTQLGDQVQWQDHLLMAQAYERADQPGQTDASFAKAIALEQPEGTYNSRQAQAQVLINRGKPAEAAAIFEQMAKDFPDNQALKLQAAEMFLRMRDFDKAEALTEALPASADRSRLLVQSASSQEGKLGIAIERAQEAVSRYPGDFGLRLNLLELLRTQQDRLAQDKRDYDKLLSMANRLSDDHPDRIEAKVALADVLLRIGRREQATAALEQALEFAPRHLPTNERLFGIKLAEARELAQINPEASQESARKALAIITILLENRPDLPVLLRSAGQAAELAGITSVAVDYYRKAFESTQDVGDLSRYASALLLAGQGPDARAVLEDANNATLVRNSLFLRALRGRAIAMSGRPGDAATLFGNLLKEVKSLEEQLTITAQVIRSFSSDPSRAIQVVEGSLGKDLPAQIDLPLTSLLIGQLEYELIAERLKKYLTNPAADTNVQFNLLTQLALALQESGNYLEAKSAYEQVFAMLKSNEDLVPKRQQLQMLNNMAYLLADQLTGYEDQAVQYAKQAVSLMSDNVSNQDFALIEDTLGWAYFKAGQIEEAIRVLKSSVDKYPLPSNQLHLGRAYLASDDPAYRDRAVLVLESAVNQAKSQGDEKLIAETTKWYREAL